MFLDAFGTGFGSNNIQTNPYPDQLVRRAQAPDVIGKVKSYSRQVGKQGGRLIVDISRSQSKEFTANLLVVDVISETRLYATTSGGFVNATFADVSASQTIEVIVNRELGIRTSDPVQVYAREVLILKP